MLLIHAFKFIPHYATANGAGTAPETRHRTLAPRACYRAAVQRRYVTVDVFTAKVFGGNPLAVVLDAEGLSTAQMQSIATEFNYSETTFVLPPRAAAHAAQVRIFTPRTEVAFAGHPTVGTAVVLARELEARGVAPLADLVLEEGAGLVPVRLMRAAEAVIGAEFQAPRALEIGPRVALEDAAACLSLPAADLLPDPPPQVLSVGLPFLVVSLASREARRRARPSLAAHERVLPPAGTDSVFAYARGGAPEHLHARMFSPLDSVAEDPATGSATAATLAFLAAQQPEGDVTWRIEQGVDMGRPSLILGRTCKRGDTVTAVHVGGHAVAVMRGSLDID
jgi:trans-2,3-dihydro-3-hydroxyanthranilate isomerase